MESKNKLAKIPTTIITGFLGTGKTSTILHLLKHKPNHERWAVLVNEFGEIGIDGSLFEGQTKEEDGVFIREVPGGCMCCTAGVSMQKALNTILTKVAPDRLLIEPTGLGHPTEVLNTLRFKKYRDKLLVQNVITIVDARLVSLEFYAEHPIFNEQISVADIIVANKSDLYKEKDKHELMNYVKYHANDSVDIVFTKNGVIQPRLIVNMNQNQKQNQIQNEHIENINDIDHHGSHHNHNHNHNHNHEHEGYQKPLFTDLPIPEIGYLKVENDGEGYKSIGWRFTPTYIFDRRKLLHFLTCLKVERMKAVFITVGGIFAYNLTKDAITEVALDDCIESRIEIISQEIDRSWQEELLACKDIIN